MAAPIHLHNSIDIDTDDWFKTISFENPHDWHNKSARRQLSDSCHLTPGRDLISQFLLSHKYFDEVEHYWLHIFGRVY